MKVLLPVDGSKPSHDTVQWSTHIFNPKTTRFYLLIAIPESLPGVPVETYQIEDALKLLEDYKDLLAKKGFHVAKAEYISGDPAESICAYADEMKIEQIVMGSHGRNPLGEFLMGSVSSAVFKHAKQPVFIHRNKALEGVSLKS